MHMYIYVYAYVYIYMHMYIYIYMIYLTAYKQSNIARGHFVHSNIPESAGG